MQLHEQLLFREPLVRARDTDPPQKEHIIPLSIRLQRWRLRRYSNKERMTEPRERGFGAGICTSGRTRS